MKKLIVLAAFLGAVYTSSNAQTVAPAKDAPKTKTVAPAPAVKQDQTVQVVPVSEDATLQAEAKKNEKSCTPSEKKSCGTAKGAKKSCCSSKK